MRPIEAPDLSAIRAAAERLDPSARHTPLIRLEHPAPQEIWLKLENLQPIGSFKLRGAGNAIASLDPSELREGVCTASAGNMAQGIAWNASRRGISCRVVVPDHAPRAKLDAVERMGGEIVPVPFDRWWQAIVEGCFPDLPGVFIHPVCDEAVVAGNGTIGLEVAEQLEGFDAVIAPFGGGGLSCGIAAALRELRPDVPVYAAEVSTAAPLAPSLEADEPCTVEYEPTFVDGIGGKSVLPPMWPLARRLLAGSRVVKPSEIAAAIRTLALSAGVVAEGAGAASVAAALGGLSDKKRVLCVVSGGNIDGDKLAAILRGELP